MIAASKGSRQRFSLSAFVERMGEEAAFAMVSQVSSLTTAAIHRHRGTVKNFTGDGILALFGTPNALEDGPLRACRAALEIQQSLAEAGDRIEAELVHRPLLRRFGLPHAEAGQPRDRRSRYHHRVRQLRADRTGLHPHGAGPGRRVARRHRTYLCGRR